MAVTAVFLAARYVLIMTIAVPILKWTTKRFSWAETLAISTVPCVIAAVFTPSLVAVFVLPPLALMVWGGFLFKRIPKGDDPASWRTMMLSMSRVTVGFTVGLISLVFLVTAILIYSIYAETL